MQINTLLCEEGLAQICIYYIYLNVIYYTCFIILVIMSFKPFYSIPICFPTLHFINLSHLILLIQLKHRIISTFLYSLLLSVC